MTTTITSHRLLRGRKVLFGLVPLGLLAAQGRGAGRHHGFHGGPWRGPGPWGGFPFGHGFPGAFGRGPMFGRGPKVGRGDVRSAALLLLAERPMHGYQIIQEIAERSDGVWRPSPGSVYPMLQQLEDEGLVRDEKSDDRRVFHLTEAGRSYVEERRDELESVWETVSGSVDATQMEWLHLVRDVALAATQVAHAGSEQQAAQARKILVETRRRLYQVLAEEEDE